MSVPFDKIFLEMMDNLSEIEQRRLLKIAYRSLENIHNNASDSNVKSQTNNFFNEVKEAISWSK